MIWLAVLMAVTGVPPGGALPVRLAPVTCPGFPDADVRAALRVEIRERLVPEAGPAPIDQTGTLGGFLELPATTPLGEAQLRQRDFALVSVACAGEDAELLIVRQSAGAAVRRLVPLRDVAADARPRAVAIAIAELLRVDLARNEPPPPPVPAAIPRKVFFAVDGSPFLVGRYFTGSEKRWFTGFQLRVLIESATNPDAGRPWGWGLGLVFDVDNPGSPGISGAAAGAVALIRRAGALVTWELGLGARIGGTSDDRINASPPSAYVYGPFGSLAVEAQSYGRLFSRFAVEGGSDSGPLGGGWARMILSGGVHL